MLCLGVRGKDFLPICPPQVAALDENLSAGRSPRPFADKLHTFAVQILREKRILETFTL